MTSTQTNILRMINGTDEVAAAIFRHLAGLVRQGKKISVENGIRICRKAGFHWSEPKIRRAVIALFKTFAGLSLGEFRLGRGTKPSRFIWSVCPRAIGCAARENSFNRKGQRKNEAPEIITLGDQLAGLTREQTDELSNYLKRVHGIDLATGGALVA